MFKIQKGFTLIELIITLVVLAVVVGMALPAFNEMVIRNRSASLGADIEVVLNYARIEAVKRATRVSICSSTDGATCAHTATDPAVWNKGWLVVTDKATTDSAAVDVDTVLRYWNDITPNAMISIKTGSGSTAVNVKYVRFNSLGKLASSNVTTANAYVTGCKSNDANDIKVGVAGMISKTKANCP
jgi:type IV fimbrial biogenesis protein FimT